MFDIGQEVECIDPTWGNSGFIQKIFCPNLPVKGKFYHIRDCFEYPSPYTDIIKCVVRLVEIVNPVMFYPCGEGEAVFYASKYRPVIRAQTNISAFQEFLKTRELEDA